MTQIKQTGSTTPQTSEQSNNHNKWEELAKQRVIGEGTRKMLIANGKICDAVSIISDVISDEYGSESDKILQPFLDAINETQRKYLELMCMIIDENLTNAKSEII